MAQQITQEKILFVISCNGLKKDRVGRSVKKNSLFFWSKMCVLCIFYIDWELGGQKKHRVMSYLNKNLLG